MASKSTLKHLAGETVNNMDLVVLYSSYVRPGTPESDRVAELLRDLNKTLVAYNDTLIALANASTK